MDEGVMFGPFTLRQFLYLAGGVLICYNVYNNVESTAGTVVIVLVSAICIAMVANAPRVVIDAEYIRRKKATTTPKEFNAWFQRTIASVRSREYAREARGLPSDPKLDAMLTLLIEHRPTPEVTEVTKWF